MPKPASPSKRCSLRLRPVRACFRGRPERADARSSPGRREGQPMHPSSRSAASHLKSSSRRHARRQVGRQPWVRLGHDRAGSFSKPHRQRPIRTLGRKQGIDRLVRGATFRGDRSRGDASLRLCARGASESRSALCKLAQQVPVRSGCQGAHSRWQWHCHGLFAAWKSSDAAHCALRFACRSRRSSGLARGGQHLSLACTCRTRCRRRHGSGAARPRGRSRAQPSEGAPGVGPAPPSRRRERGAGDGHCNAPPLTLLLRLPPNTTTGPSPPNSCILAKGCATGI